ncbi:MAG TPA: DUF1080 domain-containing protein [Pirellulales bacterium]|jgi:hypothetical protein|nr:DUF1080 domain-containing protein [Pirellulales bacterium]
MQRRVTTVCLGTLGLLLIACGQAAAQSGQKRALFDGVTLDGWIQEPLHATTLAASDFKDFPGLVKALTDPSNKLSTFVCEQLDDSVKSAIVSYSGSEDAAATKTLKSNLAKALNKIMAGPSLYDAAHAQAVTLRSETEALHEKHPQGKEAARLNRVILEDAYPNLIAISPAAAWIVKDGAMASTGAGRGVIYTKDDFTKYRLMFTMRHVSGQPDHQPCFLIFCTRPAEGEKPLDALGGIQFQTPKGSHWDYRPGKNKSGEGFTQVTKPDFNAKEWHRVEILVDATKGTARMAVAQPPTAKAVEVLDYDVPDAGRTGPIAFQMHNGGIFDEYKDVEIEIDPAVDELISTK